VTGAHDALHDDLERLFPDAGHDDWQDVLVRAESRRPLMLLRAGLALAAAFLVAVPALAATGTFRSLWSSHLRPELTLSASVRDASGVRVAGIELALPGATAASDSPGHLLPHHLFALGHGAADADRYELRWRLSLQHGGAPRRAVLAYRPKIAHAGRRVAVLCSPCADGDSGTLTLSRNEAALLVNGRLALTVEAGSAAATGVIPTLSQHGLLPGRRR